jgi:hypothetical protein
MVNHNIDLGSGQQSKYIRSEWVPASVVSPCPVCGKPDNCKVSRSGEVAWCGRVSAGSIRENGGGQYLHVLSEGPQRSGYVHPSHLVPPVVPFDQSLLERASKEPKLAELATILGVSVVALQDLGVGHLYSGAWCWSFPERAAAGDVIGVNRRYLDGKKKSMGRRGLTYADGWDRGGPILLPEGGSDAAALLTMGLSVIGRPSNLGGVDMLAELLAAVPHDRLIVVVAEDDRLKTGEPRKLPSDHPEDCPGCGQCWPGRYGAERTAAGLSERLGRPVCWSLPPGGAKDAREWLLSHGANGHRFLSGLLNSIVTVEPLDEPDWTSPPVVTVAVDGRRVVSMDEVQSVMREARMNSLNRPGVYLDRSGTGTGKTHLSAEMVVVAAERGQSVAVLVPTHDNADEWVDMVEKLGRGRVSVGKYPQRVIGDEPLPGAEISAELPKANCWNREAELAQSLGLSVGSAVCQGCPYRAKCEAVGYLAELNVASQLQVRVMTHGRGAVQSLQAVAGDCGLVIVDENALPLLRPHEAASVEELETAADLLLEVLTDPKELDLIGDAKNHDEQYRFITHLLDIVEACQRSVSAADGVAVAVPQLREWVATDGGRGVPAGVQSRLLKNMRSRKKLAALWPILFAGAMGGQLSVTRSIRPAGRGPSGALKTETIVQLHSVTDNSPPVGAVVWLQDGTADPDLVRACLPGREVIDVTPNFVPVSRHRAVQHPRDITRQTSPDVVVKIIMGLLADNPEKQRVGLICHRTHEAALQELKAKDGRVARVSYFGSGLDVAANVWLEDGCDLLVVLGTPRVNGAAVRSVLLQAGQLAAAGQDGAWSEFRWSGKTESDEPVGVMSRGYDHPAWKRAHNHLVRSRLVQAVGRGRAACEGGCDVIVVSTEECGLPITDLASIPMNATEREVLRCLVPKSDSKCDISSINKENPVVIGKMSQVGSLSKSAEIALVLGLNRKTVQRNLARLEQRGLVVSIGQRGWCLVKPPEVQESPQSAEREPVASNLASQSRVESTGTDGYDQSVVPPGDELGACPVGISGAERWESQRRRRSEL